MCQASIASLSFVAGQEPACFKCTVEVTCDFHPTNPDLCKMCEYNFKKKNKTTWYQRERERVRLER